MKFLTLFFLVQTIYIPTVMAELYAVKSKALICGESEQFSFVHNFVRGNDKLQSEFGKAKSRIAKLIRDECKKQSAKLEAIALPHSLYRICYKGCDKVGLSEVCLTSLHSFF